MYLKFFLLIAIAAAFVLGISGIEAQQAFANGIDVIDFETDCEDLSPVTVVITATNTVTFGVGPSSGPTGPAFIAVAGTPTTAYRPTDDIPAGASEGSCFITDETSGPTISKNYFISFASPVDNLSLDLYDYRTDGGPSVGDVATLTVFDAVGTPVGFATFTITSVEPDPNLATLSIQSPTGLISSAKLSFTERDIGTGIDNITFTTNGNGNGNGNGNSNGEPSLDIDIDKCVSFDKDDFEESNIRCADEASARSIIVLEGDTVFFRIDATRFNEDATGVVVNDLLPNGLEFVSSKDLLSATGGYVSATGIWSVGEISEGGTRSLLIEATVATGTCGKTLVNTAFLTKVDQAEGPLDNNEDSASVEVELTAQEEDCPTKSKGAGGHEPPTIGMNMAGNRQIVTNGMGIDGQFRTVTQQFHEEMKLIQLLTSPHTISNTIFCNEGVQECDYVGIAFTTKDFDFNDPVMKVEAQKTDGEWIISWYDPQDFIQDPDDAIPGEITFTAQIDGEFLLTSFTIVFKNKDTGQLVIGIQVRDEERGVRTFWFNEGVEFKDSDAYPSIETEFENPLEIDSLCLNEDPDYRYSCAFAKRVQLEIERAEKLLTE